MTFYVYVIKSVSSGRIYIGQTNNMERRLIEHNEPLFGKKRRYTKRDGPWKLIHKEEFLSRNEALIRERSLKNHKGRDWIKTVDAQC